MKNLKSFIVLGLWVYHSMPALAYEIFLVNGVEFWSY